MNNLQEDNLIVNTTDNNDPVDRLVNRIILKGFTKKASEIHFEPQSDCLKVSFCQDGVLTDSLNPLNKAISDALINRLKNLANLKNIPQDIPQEGKFSKNIQGNEINFWLDILPTPHGKKAIIRWWYTNEKKFNLDELIYHKDSLKLIKTIAHRSSGLLLVTGKPNSGKLTTLYALLEAKKQAGLKIFTIENRLKYSLPSINQIELITSGIVDCNAVIEEAITQNIDVILVDNLHKEKNISTIMKAAIKGSLILSSLNANQIDTAICHLLEMQIKPSLIAKTLNGVINQRLLRRICPRCRLEYKPSDIQLNRFGISNKENLKLYHANNTETNDCSYCQGVGYKGQIAIYEILPIKKQLREIIADNPPLEELKKIIQQQKFTHLLDYALDLVMAGETTFAEVERVLPDTLDQIQVISPTDSTNNLLSDSAENSIKILNISDDNNLSKEPQKIKDNYEERLARLEQLFEANSSQQLQIINLQKQVEKLTNKLDNLQENFKLYLSLNNQKSSKSENLEELIIEDNWDNLGKELNESFPRKPEPKTPVKKEQTQDKLSIESTSKISEDTINLESNSSESQDDLILDKDDPNLTVTPNTQPAKLTSQNTPDSNSESIADPW